MTEKMFLRKTCSVYASDVHFATIIFPFISKEIEKNVTIRTILEKDEEENIEKIITNVGLNSKIKEEIRRIDWKSATIEKIKNNFDMLEKDIIKKRNVDIIVLGRDNFIHKVNKAIDLWAKNNIEKLEKTKAKINIINCFEFGEKKSIENIISSHEYILKTVGLEEINIKQELQKAN